MALYFTIPFLFDSAPHLVWLAWADSDIPVQRIPSELHCVWSSYVVYLFQLDTQMWCGVQSKLSDILRTEFQEILQKGRNFLFHGFDYSCFLKKKKKWKRELKAEWFQDSFLCIFCGVWSIYHSLCFQMDLLATLLSSRLQTLWRWHECLFIFVCLQALWAI